MRPIRPSRRAELWYRAQLQRLVNLLRQSGHRILQARPEIFRRALDGLTAHDETDPAWLEEEAARFGNIGARAREMATLAARHNLGEVDARLTRAIRESVGVDLREVLAGDTRIATELDLAIATNVDLIKSIPVQHFARLRTEIAESLKNGIRWESLAKTIQLVGDVTESRARLIARDQTGKMNSDFNRVRQRSVGIDRYIWSTAQDERVRKSHAFLNDKTFRWDQPPEVDGQPSHPGQPINCRCVPIPVFNLDELDGGIEQESVAA